MTPWTVRLAAGIILGCAVLLPLWRWAGLTGDTSTGLTIASAVGLMAFTTLVFVVVHWMFRSKSRPALRAATFVFLTWSAVTTMSLLVPAFESVSLVLLMSGAVLAGLMLWPVTSHRTLGEFWREGIPASILLLVALVAAGMASAGVQSFIWDGADQIEYAAIARKLLSYDFGRFYFLLGVPATLAPAALMLEGGQYADRLQYANAMNQLMLIPQLAVALPLAIGCLARSASGRLARWRIVGALGIALVMQAYLLLPPSYVPERNASLVPLRLTGAVIGPDVIGLLFVAVAAWALVRRTVNPVIVGVISGLTLMASERHVVLVVPLFLVLLTLPSERTKAFIASGLAAAVLLPQFLYFRLSYGSWVFPNRQAIQAQRVEDRITSYADQYDFQISGEAFDWRYLPTNLERIVTENWWMWLLLLIGAVLAFRFRREAWRAWLYAVGVSTLLLVISSGWINIVVTWRYLWWTAPLTGLLLIAGIQAMISNNRAAQPLTT